MHQFMGQQRAPSICFGSEFTGAEDDVTSEGERTSLHGVGGRGGGRVSMDPNLSEIVPEASFEEGSGVFRQRFAAAAHRLNGSSRRRCDDRCASGQFLGLNLLFIFLAWLGL